MKKLGEICNKNELSTPQALKNCGIENSAAMDTRASFQTDTGAQSQSHQSGFFNKMHNQKEEGELIYWLGIFFPQ